MPITQTDFAAGQAMTEASLAIAQRLNDARGIALALHGLGRIAVYVSDVEQADWLFQQSVQTARDLGSECRCRPRAATITSGTYRL